MKDMTIFGASMGDCVHVAGVLNFLRLAQSQGYGTKFAGAAKSPEEIASLFKESGAHVLAVGYRLHPEAGGHLFKRLRASLKREGINPPLFFGGTPPVAKVARESGMFDAVFSGKEDLDEIIALLRAGRISKDGKFCLGVKEVKGTKSYPRVLGERVSWKAPYPLLRHHYGVPSVEETSRGIMEIAESGVLDVLSVGPDQNAQECFFRPEDMDRDQDGSGGVCVRTEADFRKLYESSRRGNHPLMRCYSGTRDVIRFAKLLLETIDNAWAAIPLCWYNVLDGRGPRSVKDSVAEGQEAMKWHAQRGVPVEVNEAHHWSLRDAHDAVAVVAAYLAAYNAKEAGVREYVAQYMFNTPPGIEACMDLGKMLAKIHLIESLQDENFKVYRQVRAGLSSFPVDLDIAKGQLATSTLVSMNLKPHIVHVVGYCEGDHVAGYEEVIESCRIARGVIRNCLQGMPDMTLDPRVGARKEELLSDARVLLQGIEALHGLLARGQVCEELAPFLEDFTGVHPLKDPVTLAAAIKIGLLDAPHLRGNPEACGNVETTVENGACVAVDSRTRRVISERERVETVLKRARTRVSSL